MVARESGVKPRPVPPRPRRRTLGVLLILVCFAGIGLASSAAILAWGENNEALTWLSLIADAAVVILAAEVAVRALRRRGAESELLSLTERSGQSEKSTSADYASLTVDQEGSILTWSESAESLTGYSAEQSIGNTFSFLLTAVTTDIGLQSQLLRTAVQSQRATTECWMITASGERRWVHLALAPLKGDQRYGRRFLLVLRDAGEGGTTGTAAREHDASFERILDSAMDAIITVNEEQRVVVFNPAAERLFQWARSQAIGQPLDSFIPERYRGELRRQVEEFGASGATSRRMGDQTTLLGLRRDGTEFPLEASISSSRLNGQNLYTVILRDVTEHVQAQQALQRSHEELRQHALALQTAREEEKMRIARELHDQLGQGLTALKFDVAWLRHNLRDTNPSVPEKLNAMGSMLDRIVAETRRISADLRPLILDDLGFGAAAEWLVNDFKKRTGTACDYLLDQSVQDIGEPAASALFRALQESLSNVARHAQARHVQVQVVRENGAVQLEVSDDGTEIGEIDEPGAASSGVGGLAERAMVLGGEAKATRREGGGTRVVFRVPVNGTRHHGPTQ